jgi:hypothetical protein
LVLRGLKNEQAELVLLKNEIKITFNNIKNLNKLAEKAKNETI